MKAKLTLPERPSALFLVAVVDLLAVLLIFTTLIPAVAQQAGVEIDFLDIPSRAPSVPPAQRVTVLVTDGTPAVIYVAWERIALDELEVELKRRREQDGIEVAAILGDKGADYGVVMEVGWIARSAGLEAYLGGTLSLEQEDEPAP